jgi:hypothetical protein
MFPRRSGPNLGLTYLAHTHIPTIRDNQGKTLEPLEWQLNEDGSLVFERKLPNGIMFGTRVIPGQEVIKMNLWIRNGSPAKLTGLRAQVCMMLKGLSGFNQRIHANKSHRRQLGGLPRRRRPTLDHHRLGAASSTLGKPARPLPPRRLFFPRLPSRQNRPSQRHHCVSRGQRHSSTNSKTQSPIPKLTIIQYC